MGQTYRHLTTCDRIIIRTLLQEQKSYKHIAGRIGKSVSTISREVKRNSGKKGYRPKQAAEKATARRQNFGPKKMTKRVVEYIEKRIREKYSPEQVNGMLMPDIGVKISHEWIYRHIAIDKENGGDLYKNLRIIGTKRKRKRYGKKDHRGAIKGRISIEERPKIVDEKQRIGDWEADLVSGAKHKGFLVTLVERKSKFALIGHVLRKTADLVTAEIIRLLNPHKNHTKTITFDNGREFAGHEKINKSLDCKSYFAHPYCSYERGLSENTNGLIRQYFPKKTDLRNVSREQIEFAQNQLNSRPRKTLDFKRPNDILLDISLHNQKFALGS